MRIGRGQVLTVVMAAERELDCSRQVQVAIIAFAPIPHRHFASRNAPAKLARIGKNNSRTSAIRPRY